jgi:hypothetical protein
MSLTWEHPRDADGVEDLRVMRSLTTTKVYEIVMTGEPFGNSPVCKLTVRPRAVPPAGQYTVTLIGNYRNPATAMVIAEAEDNS